MAHRGGLCKQMLDSSGISAGGSAEDEPLHRQLQTLAPCSHDRTSCMTVLGLMCDRRGRPIKRIGVQQWLVLVVLHKRLTLLMVEVLERLH